MTEQDWVRIVDHMMSSLDTINRIKGLPADIVDARALSIAATHLETAMLWVANARK